MRRKDLVVMGVVRGAFGVKGWLRVHAETEYPESLLSYPVWWVGRESHWEPYKCERGAIHLKFLVAKLESIEGREAAKVLRGMQVAVPRIELPVPEEGEYYWTDLIGLEVVNRQGVVLGKVTELIKTRAHEILVVRSPGSDFMIPFVAQYVLDVQLLAGKVQVDWGFDY